MEHNHGEDNWHSINHFNEEESKNKTYRNIDLFINKFEWISISNLRIIFKGSYNIITNDYSDPFNKII